MFLDNHKLNEILHPEFLRIERKRVGIILVLFVFGTFVIPVLHYLVPNLLRDTLNQEVMIKRVIFWWMVFFVFELFIFLRLSYAIKRGGAIPKLILIPNLLCEFGLTAMVIFQTIKYDYSLLILEYDGLVFYFILLMLSAMHLDFKISLGAGILAAVGYIGPAYWGIKYLNPVGDIPQMLEIFFMRGGGLFMAGIIAGIVASEIRTRVNNSLTMREEQQEIETLLGQQLSKDIAKELILHRKDKVGRKVVGSIMFLDIRNFTAMTDHQSPEETIEFQNAIFDPLIRIIEKNNGIIHQILGDGFMASFGIAVRNENHVEDAFKAGLEIIEAINHLRTNENGSCTKIGIGLHCGEVITGNIGNEIRKQFSIAGKNVIIASRIEQLNKKFKTQFLVSKQFADHLPGNQKLIDLGCVKVKGIDDELNILQVWEPESVETT